MKPRKFVFIVLIIFIIFLTSCVSTKGTSLEDTLKAINILKDLTVNQAYSTLMNSTLDGLTFYPSTNPILFSQESEIPGLDYMLNEWDSNARQYLKDNLDSILSTIGGYFKELKIENPTALTVENSTLTITSLLQQQYNSEIETLIYNTLTQTMNLTSYTRIKKQYNAYLETKAFIKSTTFEQYDYNIIDFLTPMLTSNIYKA
ncbi:MAG: hypothetical protein PHD05_02810 [Sphaerochaetaceae bacterium]|nr:hypothetical protein [Sphaerochaetaceae bacterium]